MVSSSIQSISSALMLITISTNPVSRIVAIQIAGAKYICSVLRRGSINTSKVRIRGVDGTFAESLRYLPRFPESRGSIGMVMLR